MSLLKWWEIGDVDLSVDFATLALAPTPNQYLVCPAGECGGQAHRAAPVYEVPVARLAAAWRQVVAEQPRVEVRSVDEAGSPTALIQRTKLLRFPDLVTVAFAPLDEGRSTLYVYSRSVYGESDLGVNARRIDAWLARLAELVGTPTTG